MNEITHSEGIRQTNKKKYARLWKSKWMNGNGMGSQVLDIFSLFFFPSYASCRLSFVVHSYLILGTRRKIYSSLTRIPWSISLLLLKFIRKEMAEKYDEMEGENKEKEKKTHRRKGNPYHEPFCNKCIIYDCVWMKIFIAILSLSFYLLQRGAKYRRQQAIVYNYTVFGSFQQCYQHTLQALVLVYSSVSVMYDGL